MNLLDITRDSESSQIQFFAQIPPISEGQYNRDAYENRCRAYHIQIISVFCKKQHARIKNLSPSFYQQYVCRIGTIDSIAFCEKVWELDKQRNPYVPPMQLILMILSQWGSGGLQHEADKQSQKKKKEMNKTEEQRKQVFDKETEQFAKNYHRVQQSIQKQSKAIEQVKKDKTNTKITKRKLEYRSQAVLYQKSAPKKRKDIKNKKNSLDGLKRSHTSKKFKSSVISQQSSKKLCPKSSLTNATYLQGNKKGSICNNVQRDHSIERQLKKAQFNSRSRLHQRTESSKSVQKPKSISRK